MTTPLPTTAAENIARAITLLETYGHGKGHYVDSDGRLCVTGALLVSASLTLEQLRLPPLMHGVLGLGITEISVQAQGLVAQALRNRGIRDLARSSRDAIVQWNDFRCDGGEDAILLLKEALVLAEARDASSGVQDL